MMPIHEYRCNSCDRTDEHLTTYEERDNPRVCPTCGDNMVRVLFSQTSFMLKGGGWYKDGYQKK